VEVKLESGKKLIKRFENVQQAQQEFWKRWIEEVFPQRLMQSKWKQEKRDLQTGDIVLRRDETAAGQTYKYAKVVRVHTSADGKVRAADIEYKLPGESVFRTTTRPIHKLVLIIPIEEQASAKAAEAVPSVPEQAGTRPAAIDKENPREKEREAPMEPEPPPVQDKGVKKPAARPKKVISRKKAGKQSRTIIVTVPKEEAEIMEIKARQKKRGRPKKTPTAGSPGPNKGSVPYPGREKCADPVSEDAILGKGGGDPPDRDKGRQLASDTGGDRT
jgi:hypothetical protein